jgi:hypothetical protein
MGKKHKKKPTYQDADLLIKLYDLRREAVMRESRGALLGKFWPKSYDDVKEIMKFDNPLNAAYRQVTSYGEMVYGMARNGIMNADYLAENAGEGMFIFAKVKPYLEQLRTDVSPVAFQNVEWITTKSKEGRKRFAMIEARVAKMAAEKK